MIKNQSEHEEDEERDLFSRIAKGSKLLVDPVVTDVTKNYRAVAKINYGAMVQKLIMDRGTYCPTILLDPLLLWSWDVQVLPPKKRTVAGRLVPSPGAHILPHTRRKLHIEIHGVPPDDDKKFQEKIKNAAEEKEAVAHVLQNQHVVLVRVFRKMTQPSQEKTLQDDHEEQLDEMISFRIEDVRVLRQKGRTCEAMTESGNRTAIRDLHFQSEAECDDFCEKLQYLSTCEEEHAKRQADLFVERHSSEDDHIHLLVEIVSAINLPNGTDRNPYVAVRMARTQVHRSKVLSKTLDPIWKLATESLFVLHMTPEEFFACTGGMCFTIKSSHMITSDDVLGQVYLSLEDLLNAKGERTGYDIQLPQDLKVSSNKKPILYLRVKNASASDIEVCVAAHD